MNPIRCCLPLPESEWVKNGMLGKIEIEALRPTPHAVKLDVEPGPRRLGLLGWKRKRNRCLM